MPDHEHHDRIEKMIITPSWLGLDGFSSLLN